MDLVRKSLFDIKISYGSLLCSLTLVINLMSTNYNLGNMILKQLFLKNSGWKGLWYDKFENINIYYYDKNNIYIKKIWEVTVTEKIIRAINIVKYKGNKFFANLGNVFAEWLVGDRIKTKDEIVTVLRGFCDLLKQRINYVKALKNKIN